jgi:type II secretory pathway pseudopilin PulG
MAISSFVQTYGAVVASTTVLSQVALSSVSEFGFTYLPSATSNILQSNTNPVSTQNIQSAQTKHPDSLSGNDGLPTGAKVGIAVGVVVVVLLAILLAAILWRQKVNRAKASASETAITTGYSETRGQIFEKDSKTAPTTSVTGIKYSPKPSDVDTTTELDHIHKPSNLSSELPHQPLGPSPTYVEISAPVPSEIDTTHQHRAGGEIPQRGFEEADSILLSHNITSVPSELEDPSYTLYHQPSSSPKIPFLPTPQSLHCSSTSANEPTPSTSSVLPTTPYATSHTRKREEDKEDVELSRMKTEIEALKKEKELVQHLQDIEARERELRRKIVERESEALEKYDVRL